MGGWARTQPSVVDLLELAELRGITREEIHRLRAQPERTAHRQEVVDLLLAEVGDLSIAAD